MNLKILSHAETLLEVQANPQQYDVVFITNPEKAFYIPEIADFVTYAKSVLICKFHDAEFNRKNPLDREGVQCPRKEDVQEIIDFAKNKENIIVSCRAGVSRSSASAFVILCCKQDAKEALSILQEKHDPNALIVKYGSEILNKPEMVEAIQAFKCKKLV